MRLEDFDYDLPPELVAQEPVEPRDASRLLVVHRAAGRLEHRQFRDLPDYLHAGDVLVRNVTRVLRARLVGRRSGGGPAELLLLEPRPDGTWEALARPARRLRPGVRLRFDPPAPGGSEALDVTVTESLGDGRVAVRVEAEGSVPALLEVFGRVPLPPYIRRPLADPGRYQTVYAAAPGSAAAPTAGLHFTPAVLERLAAQEVDVADLILHVGLGTFLPVREADLERHRLHAERYEVPPAVGGTVRRAREAGGRVVAVGTTVTRALEAAADPDRPGLVRPQTGRTELFIRPGHRWRVVDALLTNFHLPRSTLLMLVSAFAGRELVLEAYREAVRRRYRFYSFGDAMLLL